MKIRGKDNDLSQDAVKIQQQNDAAATRKANNASQVANQVLGALKQGGDTVDISLAQAINQQLDPNNESEAAARRKKVENLKHLIQSGQYNPPSQDVAKAVGEDIVFEILSGSGGQ